MDQTPADATSSGSRFSRLHLFILLVMVAVVAELSWATWSARSMMLTFVPQVNAAMQSRISLTESHLWLEEIVSGDASENPQQVWDKISEARWYVNAMLNGGERDARVYLPVDDEDLRADLNSALASLDLFDELAHKRVKLAAAAHAAALVPAASPAVEEAGGEAVAESDAPAASGEEAGEGEAAAGKAPAVAESAAVGSALDQEFDEAFEAYFAIAEKIEARLLTLAANALDVFVALQVALIVVVALLFSWVVWLLVRKEATQRDEYMSRMQESFSRLEQNQRELERQNAQRGALVELAASLQGLDDPVLVADTALRELCGKTGAQVGVFWGRAGGTGLLRMATHALPAERADILTLDEGEGLAGRVALDQRPVSVDIPSDYLPVTSGLGMSAAPHLRVLPLVHDSTTVGVVELVFLSPPDEFVQGLLASAAPAIAVRLQMAGQGQAA